MVLLVLSFKIIIEDLILNSQVLLGMNKLDILYLAIALSFLNCQLPNVLVGLSHRCFQQVIFAFDLLYLDLLYNILMAMSAAAAFKKVIAIADATILVGALGFVVVDVVEIVCVDGNLGHSAVSE